MRKIFLGNLPFDWRVVTITVASTLLLIVDSYFPMTRKWLAEPWWKLVDRMVLYFFIPMLIIIFVFREHPRAYGFTMGDWRAGIAITLIAIGVISPALWLVGRMQGMSTYYTEFLEFMPWNVILDLLGWEFFFRGWILFGYERKFGPEALWLQAVPFALAHIGKPALETMTTIFGGFAFGWVAWRTRSFLYPFLIHWFIFTFTVLVASGVIG